jgi:hypothetical protein
VIVFFFKFLFLLVLSYGRNTSCQQYQILRLISLPLAAALLGFNMTYETMLVVGIPGLTTSTTGNASTFHLSDLAQHLPRAVEHDGSLSREDAYFGDARSFSPQAWNRTLGSWGDIEIIDVTKSLLKPHCINIVTNINSLPLQRRSSRPGLSMARSIILSLMLPLREQEPCSSMGC